MKQSGLIASPESAKRSNEGIAIAIGPLVMEVQVGDSLLLRSHSGVGTEIRYDGSDFVLVDATDILMILPAA
jgi:co-chaperonin GroES (HSP10)